MNRIAWLALAASATLWAQDVKRPPITGVAHIALYVKDIAAARNFYTGLLGYQECFDLKNADGSLSLTFVKVNDRQYIELFPEQKPATDRLNHISIETTDAEAMRKYLASKGVKVPEKVGKGRIGNLNFNVKDPEGHTVEIVQYMPDGWSMRDKGKFMPKERASGRILHVGILVGSLSNSMAFYRDILGFQEFWRGTRDPKALSWVNMRVPEGTDYIEFMLYKDLPAETARGTQHHVALEVPDMDASLKWLEPRAKATGYSQPMEIRTGVNRRRQLNLFDPDGTRSELMEPRTVDGVPPQSSPAPPPIE
jgi:catechol 2,3-dioxygenase-like lactoylglutathione lyase family enzyme